MTVPRWCMTARARWLLRNRSAIGMAASFVLVAGVTVVGCRPTDPDHPGPGGRGRVAPQAYKPDADVPTSLLPSQVPPTQKMAATAPAASETGAAVPLPSDEGERDPMSETVTIAVQVEPPKVAHVFWGPKDLGVAPLQITRPRASGPIDLILRAPGFLSVHTRAFTDRNDRIAVHLVPEGDASRMFGYRPPTLGR